MSLKTFVFALSALTLGVGSIATAAQASAIDSDIKFLEDKFGHPELNALNSMSLEEKFLMGQMAFHQQDLGRLLAVESHFGDNPIRSYVHAWTLVTKARLGLENSQLTEDTTRFLDAHRDDYIYERFNADWLMASASKLHQTKNWKLFQQKREALQWNADEAEFVCWDLFHRFKTAPKSELKNLNKKALAFLKVGSRNDIGVCKNVANEMIRRTPSTALPLVIVHIQQNRLARAKYALEAYAKSQKNFPIKEARLALNNPTRWFNRYRHQIKRRHKDVVLIATYRLIRVNIEQAAQCATQLSARLSSQERASVWGRIGYNAALNHMPKALDWYSKGGSQVCRGQFEIEPSNCLNWRLRSALRAQNWKTLIRLIDASPQTIRLEPAWIYWKGRALAATGQRAKAIKLWNQLPDIRSYYGKLAAEELKKSILYRTPNISTPTRETLAKLDDNPHFLRAKTFYQLGLNNYGHREWNWALRKKTASELLLMAYWAKEEGLLHRMINTAERVRSLPVDANLLYPRPYLEKIQSFSRQADISDDWVYGLIRQESRFITTARSSVGANGLMQIMPATAQWVANQIQYENFELDKIYNVDVNLHLGTAYLRLLMNRLDNNIVLSTAGYNAGPHRSYTWRSTLTKPVEGAIFVETIPFTETRIYVQNVLANMVEYSQISGKPIQSLKNLLGTIDPKPVTSNEKI